MNSISLFIEIGQSSLKALHGEEGLELPLTRGENGRLAAGCRDEIKAGLQRLLNRSGWSGKARGVCAIGARGLSLRRLSLPAAAQEEQQKVLLLQIESEFPLSPAELAWGNQPVHGPGWPRAGSGSSQELMVAAVKREVVEDYAELLEECGVAPIFTVAALVRAFVCPQPPGMFAILDIGRHQSELVSFDNGVPVSVRVLPWGGENTTRLLQDRLSIGVDEAERLKIRLDQSSPPDGDAGREAPAAITASYDNLAALLNGNRGQRIFLTGKSARNRDLAPALSQRVGGVQFERVDLPSRVGVSAATLGAKLACERNDGLPPLVIGRQAVITQIQSAPPAPWKWAAAAAVLAIGFLVLPYAEAYFRKPALTQKLVGMKAQIDRLPTIDREFNFLEFLKANQAPYSDALIVIANSAPPGAKLEALSLNRHGDVTLRGQFGNGNQVTDFRNALIKSGFFATAAVDEQAPIPNQNGRVNLRMTLQWKPASARESLKIAPTPSKGGRGGGGGGMDAPSFDGMPPGMMTSMPSMPVDMPVAMPTPGPGAKRGSSAARRGGPPTEGGPPPNVSLPAGFTLPPGVTLPDGVTLPEGFTVPPDAKIIIQGGPQ